MVSSTTSNLTSPINNRMARKRQTKKKVNTTTSKKAKGTKLNYQREVEKEMERLEEVEKKNGYYSALSKGPKDTKEDTNMDKNNRFNVLDESY